MFDPTPEPYGCVTRRWSHLSDDERDRQALRLVGVPEREARLARPTETTGHYYRQVVTAAVGGDPVAFAWLAVSHRAFLLARGRTIFDNDPAEWGAVSLEMLHKTLLQADLNCGRWLRRAVRLRLGQEMARTVGRHLKRVRAERATDPDRLGQLHPPMAAPAGDPHPDLSIAIEQALAGLDAPTRDALVALAHQEPLIAVSARHQLSPEALRQRVHRARARLRPQLAAYHRTVA